MPTLTTALSSVTPAGTNQRLLGTALAGLLCLATAGCSNKQETQEASDAAGAAAGMPGSAGAPDAAGGTASASASGAAGAPATGGTSNTGGAGGSADAPGGSASGGVSDTAGTAGAAGAGGTAGAGGAAAEPPHITSSKDAGVLTADDFKALCDERAGTVELMPHCGGFATAKGFSYDAGTQLLSEHTCMGTNTCGGWNCVTDE